ncbi:DNA recombination protein RmuC, partial [Brevundimonas sp.]|uniref:DNA recombination protein RmuC n=1 Tax=Brevundimonas sp. TaxID=1871086 RepID=UPI002AB9B818
DRLPDLLRGEMASFRQGADQLASTQRLELNSVLKGMADSLNARIAALNQDVNLRLQALAEVQQKTGENLAENQRLRLNETNAAVLKLTETLTAQQIEGRKAMHEELEKVRQTLSGNLESLRKENEAKLEQMRLTVDEKLQATLDQRLDASFKQVSDRLESVQKGLGEMQSLATGVGDLKRVLTNVKSRGTWGEVQLGALLEDTLTTEQYAGQVQVRPRSNERVDFAVRLPGQDENGQVWLPIDCKFPHEDYARLVAAQEAADPVEAAAAGKALERAIAAQARSVAEKYISPPHTTDFAYLYLPTEGLFAEIVRREGFAAELRAKHRVELAGPSTLTALLNSLRVGFRSLQIQKKSSEVWTELGKVKTAFEKYGDALEAVDVSLERAKSKVSDVNKRHKAVVHSLRNVENVALPEPAATPAALIPEMPEAD